MGTRSYAEVAPTAATMALNAYIFGYAGHSLVTPHSQLKQVWWSDERIDAKVTRTFIASKLRGHEREFLNKPLAFGEGLTDDTYMEWILEKAKRFFLILTEIGCPDQIFGCIDDSWDDTDLPLSMDLIGALHLSIDPDEALDKKFYNTQFIYLLRELKKGSHIDYGPKEHIPMDNVNTVPPAVTLQVWDRIHFPGKLDNVYMRRKYALSEKNGSRDYRSSFLKDVRRAQSLEHEHIASMWASYTTAQNAGYVISDLVGEHTLGTFIDHRNPAQFQRVSAPERPLLLCEWMHCLADALASLHHRGVAHTAIRPSNVLVDRSNRIAFADVGSLKTFQRGKRVNKTEIYDYAAPESQQARLPITTSSSPPISSRGAFNKLRKRSTSTTGSSTSSSTDNSSRSNSLCTESTGPPPTPLTGRSNSMTSSIKSPLSPLQRSPGSIRSYSRRTIAPSECSNGTIRPPPSPAPTMRTLPYSTTEPMLVQDPVEAVPEPSDIYSLACIFLDILTFMLKGKNVEFVKFRTTRVVSSLSNSKRAKNDTSFHSDPDKIEAWMRLLADDAAKRTERIYRGVPEILKLIRWMMGTIPANRPKSIEVRDRLEEVLSGTCGMETLCCADRVWEVLAVHDSPGSPSTSRTESMNVASEVADDEASAVIASTQSGDHMSMLSKTESKDTSTTSRRGSSASQNGPRFASWRRKFSRT